MFQKPCFSLTTLFQTLNRLNAEIVFLMFSKLSKLGLVVHAMPDTWGRAVAGGW